MLVNIGIGHNHLWRSLLDSYKLTSKCWLTSKDLQSSHFFGHLEQFTVPARSSGLLRWMAYVRACVCVCVKDREREGGRERERGREGEKGKLILITRLDKYIYIYIYNIYIYIYNIDKGFVHLLAMSKTLQSPLVRISIKRETTSF